MHDFPRKHDGLPLWLMPKPKTASRPETQTHRARACSANGRVDQKHAPKNLRILASPALRCQQTAKALDLPFETDKRLGTDSNVSTLLAAVNWPDGGKDSKGNSAVLVVGHQPTLGQTAALLLSGEEAYWSIKKGAVWWFSNRTRQGESQMVLRAVIPPDFGH